MQTVSHFDSKTALGPILDDLFTYFIPWKLIRNAIKQLFDSIGFMDYLVYRYIYHRNSVQLFLNLESTIPLYVEICM